MSCGAADTALCNTLSHGVHLFRILLLSPLTYVRSPVSTRLALRRLPRNRLGALLYPLSRQTRKMTTSLISNRLASRCTIVTGSSSGLGRAIALAFAANGASPIVCTNIRSDPHGDWSVDEASVPTHQLVCRRYGEGKAHFVQADVIVSMEVEQVVKKAVEVGGKLDV